MHRPITDFKMDEHGDWIAFLSCGHKQHVRHQPPFFERPWVTTERGRSEKVGEPLDCVRCERFEMPDDFAAYPNTPEFTENTIPEGLLNDHSTRPGVWGRIHVIEGELIYRVDALNTTFEIIPDAPGIVIPEIKHYIEPADAVRFFFEFYRKFE